MRYHGIVAPFLILWRVVNCECGPCDPQTIDNDVALQEYQQRFFDEFVPQAREDDRNGDLGATGCCAPY